MLKNNFSLKNKVVVITGATGILGSQFVRCLYHAGAIVVITDLILADCLKLKRRVAGNNARLIPLELDITSKASIDSAIRAIVKKFGRIDALINNAVLRASATDDFFSRKPEDFFKTTNVNINGTFLITRAVAKIMKKQRSGTIINMGSIYGIVSNDQTLYSAGFANYDYYTFHKGGILNFTRFLAATLGKYNIRVNAISPGGILWTKKGGGAARDKAFRERYNARVPLGRMANPDEINGVLLFLLSDDASYITGHNLVVDGGWTAI